MTDPAVEQWREATDRPKPHLETVKQERDDARHELAHADMTISMLNARLEAARVDRDAATLLAEELRAEVRNAYTESADLRAQLEREMQRRADVHAALTTALVEGQRDRALLDDCMARFATEIGRLHRLLDQARAQGFQPLLCLDCGQLLEQGQDIEPQPGTTKGSWIHACCPDPDRDS